MHKQEFKDRENSTVTNHFVTYVQSSNLRHARTLVLTSTSYKLRAPFSIGYPTNCKDLRLGIPHPKTSFEGYHTFNEQEGFFTFTQYFNLELQI